MAQKQKKKLPWQQWLVTAFALGVGACCGLVFSAYLDRMEGIHIAWSLLLLLAGVWAAVFLHILLHEGGHLIFGLLTGYRFSSFRVGSLMLIRTGGKLRLKWYSLAGTGGQCLMEPPEMVDGKLPVVLFNLGGVILDLAGCVLWLGLYLALRGSLVEVLFLVALILGLLQAITNGVPLQLSMVNNDGRNALALSRNPQAQRAFWVQLKVAALQTQGAALKEMPAEWFVLPENADLKNPMTVVIEALRTGRLMEEKRFAEAEVAIEKLLNGDTGLSGINRNLLLCDRMYLQWLRDPTLHPEDAFRQTAFQKFLKQMKNSPTVLRVWYTHTLLRQQNPKEAEKYRVKLEKISKTYPYAGDILQERQLMEIARQRNEEQA